MTGGPSGVLARTFMSGGPLAVLGLHSSQPEAFGDRAEVNVLNTALATVLIQLETEGGVAGLQAIKADADTLAWMLGNGHYQSGPLRQQVLQLIQGLNQVDPAKVQRAIGAVRTHVSLFGESAAVVAQVERKLAGRNGFEPTLGGFPIGLGGAIIVPVITFTAGERMLGTAAGANQGIALVKQTARSVIDSLQPRSWLGAKVLGPKKLRDIKIQLSNGVSILIRAESPSVDQKAAPTRLHVRVFSDDHIQRQGEFDGVLQDAFRMLMEERGPQHQVKVPGRIHRVFRLAQQEGIRLTAEPRVDEEASLFLAKGSEGGRFEIGVSKREGGYSWFQFELSPVAVASDLSVKDRFLTGLEMFLEVHAGIFTLLSVPPAQAEETP